MRKLSPIVALFLALSTIITRAQHPVRQLPRLTGFDVVEATIYDMQTDGIGEAMATNNLDALLFPGSSSAGIAARAGFPTVIIPCGFIPNAPTPAFPAGFTANDQPYGVGFTGLACSEPA